MLFTRSLACAAVALLISVNAPAQPTDKLPPGMNRPVGGPGANPGRPGPPAPRPPGPVRPPPRPGPVRPVPARPRPPRPRPPINHLPRHRYRLGAYQRPSGYFFRQWTTGAVLPGLFRAQNYWLTTPRAYGLRQPPPGTEWVRVDYDALLVSNATGQVIDIVYNIFY